MTYRPKAIVCLSGGMDSVVCAALAAKDHETHALHFSYGQRTEKRELRAAQDAAAYLQLAGFMHLSVDIFRKIGGSALTDPTIPIPTTPSAPLPLTYVPFRNTHFLAAAVSWAEVMGAKKIFIGAVEQDSSGYPDCRPAYYEAFNQLIRRGTGAGDIEVVTPLIALRKSEIVRLGVETGAPLHVSWSCYSGEDLACGVCDSCVLRLRAFAAAGSVDAIPYEVAT